MRPRSKKPRKRKLPKDITERPDAEALELIFGKRAKRKLDKVTEAARRR